MATNTPLFKFAMLDPDPILLQWLDRAYPLPPMETRTTRDGEETFIPPYMVRRFSNGQPEERVEFSKDIQRDIIRIRGIFGEKPITVDKRMALDPLGSFYTCWAHARRLAPDQNFSILMIAAWYEKAKLDFIHGAFRPEGQAPMTDPRWWSLDQLEFTDPEWWNKFHGNHVPQPLTSADILQRFVSNLQTALDEALDEWKAVCKQSNPEEVETK